MAALRTDRGPDGRLRAWVCASWDRIVLRQCADIVQMTFGGEARDRVGGSDLVFWDFMVDGVLVTVHLERGVGIAVLANDSSAASETLVTEIATYLLERAELSSVSS